MWYRDVVDHLLVVVEIYDKVLDIAEEEEVLEKDSGILA